MRERDFLAGYLSGQTVRSAPTWNRDHVGDVYSYIKVGRPGRSGRPWNYETILQALRVLEQAGLARRTMVGRTAYWSINSAVVGSETGA